MKQTPNLNNDTFIQKVEKDAFIMIKTYGKSEAIKVAIVNANYYVKDIDKLKHYDGDRIKCIDDMMWYWFTVASTIKNFN